MLKKRLRSIGLISVVMLIAAIAVCGSLVATSASPDDMAVLWRSNAGVVSVDPVAPTDDVAVLWRSNAVTPPAADAAVPWRSKAIHWSKWG